MAAATLEAVEFDPFAGDSVECVIHTSEAQREVWLADKLSVEASLAFNESVSLCLGGPLNMSALCGALESLLSRHQSLRCTVGPDGTELLVSARSALDIPQFDLASLNEEDRRRTLEESVAEAVQAPFNLEQGPLFRCALFRLSPSDHVLLMTAHHIICDGWSWGLVTEDLGALYAEQLGLAPAPEAADRYADYVAWEVAEAVGPAMAEHEAFWLKRFSGTALPVLDLPADRPRAPVRSFNSRRIDHVLDAGLVSDVRKLGAKSGASVFATLFTGLRQRCPA